MKKLKFDESFMEIKNTVEVELTLENPNLDEDFAYDTFNCFRRILMDNDFESKLTDKLDFEPLIIYNNLIRLKQTSIIYQLGLKKTYEVLQQLEFAFKFMFYGAKNKKIKNVFFLIWKSIQDLQTAIEFKAYYAVAFEYRKLLEACLFVEQLLKTNSLVEAETLIENYYEPNQNVDYVKLFVKNNLTSLSGTWTLCDDIMTINKGIMLISDTNYQEHSLAYKISEHDILSHISQTIEFVSQTLLQCFDLFANNLYVQRFKKILALNQASIDLKTDQIVKDKRTFAKLTDNNIQIKRTKHNTMKINEISSNYKVQLTKLYYQKHCEIFNVVYKHLVEDYQKELQDINNSFSDEFHNLIDIFQIKDDLRSDLIQPIDFANFQNVRDKIKFVSTHFDAMWFIMNTILVCDTKLFLLEQELGTNLDIARFRSLLEDLLYCVSVEHNQINPLLFSICEFAKTEFKTKTTNDEVIEMINSNLHFNPNITLINTKERRIGTNLLPIEIKLIKEICVEIIQKLSTPSKIDKLEFETNWLLVADFVKKSYLSQIWQSTSSIIKDSINNLKSLNKK